MKFILAFTLFLFAHCLVPTTGLAIAHPSTNMQSSSSLVFKKKTGLKEKLNLKMTGQAANEWKRSKKIFVTAFVILALGVLLIIVGIKKANESSPNNGRLEFKGLGETILGGFALLFGLFELIRSGFVKNKEIQQEEKEKKKQMP